MEHYEKERLRNNNAIYEEQKRTREAGERKLRLYLDTKEALTEREYMQIALENNLIKEEELSQNISREAAKAVLEKLSNLYYTEFWIENYEKIEYKGVWRFRRKLSCIKRMMV